MAFNTTDLDAYIEQADFPIVAKMQLTGGLAQHVNIQSGLKGTSELHYISSDVVFGPDGCSRTASGTTTLTNRPITVGAIAISTDLCVKSLNGFYTQKMIKKGAQGEESLPGEIEGIWLEQQMNAIKKQIAICDIQGDTLSSTNNLSYYDGLLKLVDADASVINGNTLGATAVTEANILSILDAMYKAIPADVKQSGDAVITIPQHWMDMYHIALKNANLFHYVATEGDAKLYGSNINLRVDYGFGTLNRALAYSDSNITVGMDGDNDEEALKVRLDPVSEKSILFDLTFKRGIQYAFGSDIVEFTLA